MEKFFEYESYLATHSVAGILVGPSFNEQPHAFSIILISGENQRSGATLRWLGPSQVLGVISSQGKHNQ